MITYWCAFGLCPTLGLLWIPYSFIQGRIPHASNWKRTICSVTGKGKMHSSNLCKCHRCLLQKNWFSFMIYDIYDISWTGKGRGSFTFTINWNLKSCLRGQVNSAAMVVIPKLSAAKQHSWRSIIQLPSWREISRQFTYWSTLEASVW